MNVIAQCNKHTQHAVCVIKKLGVSVQLINIHQSTLFTWGKRAQGAEASLLDMPLYYWGTVPAAHDPVGSIDFFIIRQMMSVVYVPSTM